HIIVSFFKRFRFINGKIIFLKRAQISNASHYPLDFIFAPLICFITGIFYSNLNIFFTHYLLKCFNRYGNSVIAILAKKAALVFIHADNKKSIALNTYILAQCGTTFK